jgi:hypothetical protein
MIGEPQKMVFDHLYIVKQFPWKNNKTEALRLTRKSTDAAITMYLNPSNGFSESSQILSNGRQTSSLLQMLKSPMDELETVQIW